jgi:hypothetical protein
MISYSAVVGCIHISVREPRLRCSFYMSANRIRKEAGVVDEYNKKFVGCTVLHPAAA